MQNRLFKFYDPCPDLADIYDEPWDAGSAMWQLERVFTIEGREPCPADLERMAVGDTLRLTDETGYNETTLTRVQ